MLKTEFVGFVDDVKTFDWGTIVKMTHNQRQLNDQGSWETIGKDYIDVKVKPEHLASVTIGQQLEVIGSLKVKTYQKKDGTSGVQINVTAFEVKPAGSYKNPGQTLKNLGATQLIEEAPF
jgi:single-stranded DNA-binding protein